MWMCCWWTSGCPMVPASTSSARRLLRPACNVMVVTMFGDEDNMIQAFEAGARGYLIKDGTEQEVARHVRDLSAGGSPMSPMIARRLLQTWSQRGVSGAQAPAPPSPSGATAAAALGGADQLTPKSKRCSASYREASPTKKSPPACTFRSRRSEPTCATSTASLMCTARPRLVFEARALGLLR